MKSRRFSLEKRIVFEERRRRGDDDIRAVTSFRDGEDVSGEDVLAHAICPPSSSRLFSGVLFGQPVSIWPLCNSPGVMKHTRASRRFGYSGEINFRSDH